MRRFRWRTMSLTIQQKILAHNKNYFLEARIKDTDSIRYKHLWDAENIEVGYNWLLKIFWRLRFIFSITVLSSILLPVNCRDLKRPNKCLTENVFWFEVFAWNRSNLNVWIYWILVSNRSRPFTLLIHVGSSDQFATEVKVSASCDMHIQFHIAQTIFQVSLISVEHPSAFFVMS